MSSEVAGVVFDNSIPASEQIMRLAPREKAVFLRDALMEVHMYGVPSAGEWLAAEYGLSHEQTLAIALEVLTINGAESVVTRT